MARHLRSLLLLSSTTVAAAVALTVTAAPASAEDYGPYTCLQGYVWREAVPGDKVCVTPATREQARKDNALAAKRRQPGGGPYGYHTCRQGYVWREATPQDKVCVTPAVRTQTAKDNAAAATRWVSAKIWLSRYTDGPVYNGDGTATTTSVSDIARIKLNGSHYNLGQVRVYVRYNSGKVAFSKVITAKANAGYAGGSWGVKTGLFDCSRPGRTPNGYAQAQDVLSGRWSAKLPVHIGCAVL